MGNYNVDRENPARRSYGIWNNARGRAKRTGIPFTISLGWLEERMDTCAVTGLPLDHNVGTKGRPNPFAPSLDQRSPGKGYTEDNTQVVCWIYNAAKHTASHEDVVRFAHALTYPQVHE